jgi:hypothetical protein
MSHATPAYKTKALPLRPASPVLQAALQSCAVLLAINWLAQGMRGMGWKELAFRLGLEAGIAALLLLAMSPLGVSWLAGLACAAIGAHSFSFVCNGQLWVCARYCRWFRGDPVRLERFLAYSAALLRTRPWLDEAVILGSTGSGRLAERSDIDLRLVFPPGLRAWLRVNLLLLKLRVRALLEAVPLDLYAYDRPDALARFDPGEPLVIVLDRQCRLVRRFAERDLRELA